MKPFAEAGDLKRLSDKRLVDTYSKRSKTLIEKVSISSLSSSSFALISITSGQRIGRIDRCICGDLHGEVSNSCVVYYY